MIYSQLYLKDRFKVPTVITLLFIFILVIFFARLFTNSTVPSRASNTTIKRVEIANLSPYQASIYWQTANKEKGWIILGESESQLNQVVLDERDVSSKINPYINHFAVLKNLKENHRYFFKVFGNDKVLTFSTPQSSQTAGSLSPAYGKVIKSNDQPLENAIVIISFDNTFPLIALTKVTGEWLIPLNIKAPSNREPVTIEIISEDNEISTVIAGLSQLSPIPQTIVMGKNYNFVEAAPNVLSATTDQPNETKKAIDILYPKENALIPGRTPLIKGVSQPKSEVFIVINSKKTYSAKVVSDTAGNWSYSLPENLELGKHTITITSTDEKGNQVLVQRNFTIIGYEGGDARVLGVATNEPVISGAPTFTPVPTYPPTPTTQTASPSAPVSGGSSFMIQAIGGASLIIVGMGIILAF